MKIRLELDKEKQGCYLEILYPNFDSTTCFISLEQLADFHTETHRIFKILSSEVLNKPANI